MKKTYTASWQQICWMLWNRITTACTTGPAVTSNGVLRRAGAALFLTVGLCLISVSPAMADPAPGCPGCDYRRPITIAPAKLGVSCGADLTGFPVLVEINDDINLRYVDNGGHVEYSSGDDIAFTDAGGTPLNHEVELYNAATGTLVAWVKVPTLSKSADTVIYLYYGDSGVSTPTQRPDAVWDTHYKGVWHLNQTPTNAADDILDSTANANHGDSDKMNAGDRTDGRIGDALDFDGINDYVQIGELLGSGSNLTISAWVKHDGIASIIERYIDLGNKVVIRHSGGSNPGQLHFYIRTDGGVGRHLRANGVLTVGAWYYVVGTWDGTTQRVYANGQEKASQLPPGILDPPGTGKFSNAGETMDGIIDEVRISDTPRDACWIETEYGNQVNPAAFHLVGDEEETDSAVPTWTITATAGPNGSIHEAGDVVVDEGDSPTFLLVAADGYEVDTVSIDGGPAEDYGSDAYQFINVTADTSIAVTFKALPAEPPPVVEEPPTGCAQNKAADYTGGFNQDHLDRINTEVNDDGHIKLNTGNEAIDPDNIVLPFRQQVAVTLLYEGGGNKLTDFGWMLASEDPGDRTDPPHRIIYQNINDNNNNGVLDISATDPTDRFDDRNRDGHVDVLDNREVLGTFDAGTELVFFLKVDEGQVYRNNKPNPVTGVPVTDYGAPSEQVYIYSKTAWNLSKFTSRETISMPEWSCDRDWGNPFEKTYKIGQADTGAGACLQENGWMNADGLARAADPFGLNFGFDDTASLSVAWDVKWPAVMVGAPADEPNAWVLGFEDLVGGGDMDHNDLIFIIERETGGTAGLKPDQPISPTAADANITGVTLGVWDEMPAGACAGQTDITYWLSIDAGANWVEVDGWDEVYNFTLVGDQKVLGEPATNWIPGAPARTYRTRRVDFTGLGLSGRALIWRADFKSGKEGCEPKIMDMSLNLSAAVPGHIARATPTVLANVIYSGSMETRTSAELRGHLKNTLIYHPQYPNHTFNDPAYPDDPDCQDDPGWTDCPVLWEAGDELNQMALSGRKIYIPNVTVHTVDSGSAEQLGTGDGVTTFFSGRLARFPVLATTVRMTDMRETFADRHTDELDGDLGGSGWINRFTGHYRLTFGTPPTADQPITAAYSYFTYNPGTLREFKENTVAAAELGLDNSAAVPSGHRYDFNGDDDFGTPDVNWLINWTRGYADHDADGNAINPNDKTDKKDWVLGALDHSVPAVATPPASAPWYYGTAFPEDKKDTTHDRKGYREFRDDQAGRRTVVYAGARDGMLHAFDTGVFRWGDNPCTDVSENRGYFQWTNPDDADDCQTSCTDDCEPDYGTGQELWAFIPANLLPRLKNNYLQGDDQAYVDASPALADVHTGGDWRTVLLSAEGNGGDTIFCLDVTDPATPLFMWEFADPELFRSRSSPAVARIGRILYQGGTKWVAFFVSGKTYDDTLYPSIFVIDIADGSLVKKIDLDAEPAGAGGVLSGQPTIVDSDGNGYVDRLYIGSDKGRLYKVNIPDDPDSAKHRVSHCVVNTDFSDRDENAVPGDWHYQPIYGSPTVVSSNSADKNGELTYDIRIFFGTGDSPYFDEDINFVDTRYLFYAYRDTTAKMQCADSGVVLDWFFELPEGHRIYASAFAAAGNIYFGTSTGETEDPCDISADSDADFDANAGNLYAFDMDNPDNAPLRAPIRVGNVMGGLVVDDKHIYLPTVSGGIKSFGNGQYNSATRQGGIPKIDIHWWREMF